MTKRGIMGLCLPVRMCQLASLRSRSHVPEVVATIDARQRSWPISSERRRSGWSSTGRAGGWGDGDAILYALEGSGRGRIRRGCRVTWHSQSFNARTRTATPVVEQVRFPPVLLWVLHLTRRLASRSCLPLPQPLFISVCRERESRRPEDASTSAHLKCHYRYGPYHLFPLLPPLRQEADAYFDGWIGCCWQDDHSV